MNVLIPSQISNKWSLIKRTDLANKIMTVAISHYESSVAPPPPPQIPVAAGKEEAMLDTRCFLIGHQGPKVCGAENISGCRGNVSRSKPGVSDVNVLIIDSEQIS